MNEASPQFDKVCTRCRAKFQGIRQLKRCPACRQGGLPAPKVDGGRAVPAEVLELARQLVTDFGLLASGDTVSQERRAAIVLRARAFVAWLTRGAGDAGSGCGGKRADN